MSIFSFAHGQQRTKKEARLICKEIIRKVDKGTSFEELVRKHSDDSAGRARGGLYRHIERGDMIHEIEDRIDHMAINELSKPVDSIYGYIVFQLLENSEDEYSMRYLLITYQKRKSRN